MTKSRPPQVHVTRKHLARAEREALLQRWVIGATIGVVVLIVGLLAWAWVDQTILEPRKPVASVGGVQITVEQFQKAVKYRRVQMVNQLMQLNQYVQLAQSFGADANTIQYYQQQAQTIDSQLSQPDVIGRQALDGLIDEQIVRQEAARRNITVSAAEIDTELQKSLNYYPNGTPTPGPTSTLAPTDTPAPTETPDPKLTPTVTATATEVPSATPTATAGPSPTPFPSATPYTLEGFNTRRADLIANLTKLTGMSEADYRDLIEFDLLVKKLQATYTDVPKTIKTVHARHILIKIDDQKDPAKVAAAEAIAKDIISQLQKGANFADLAKKYSIDTSNKDKGGDLGTQDDGTYVAEFNKVVFDEANKGLYPTPVQSQFGFHIIDILEHGTRTLTDTEYSQKQQTAYNAWLSQQKADTKLVNELDWQTHVPTHPDVTDVINSQPSPTPGPTTAVPAATDTPQPTAKP